MPVDISNVRSALKEVGEMAGKMPESVRKDRRGVVPIGKDCPDCGLPGCCSRFRDFATSNPLDR
eukprot:13632807-Alexandrium_andersonii.AAC.1